jgi:hypothetical protein
MRPVRIVGGELQREPEWTDEEYAERLGAAQLMALATTNLVREMMKLPDDATDFGNHAWHCVAIADGVEMLFERVGYWSPEASQARMDVKTARLRTIKYAVEHARADAVERGDWTAEDDRLVLIGQIADTIETMPHDQLERVLVLAQHISEDD